MKGYAVSKLSFKIDKKHGHMLVDGYQLHGGMPNYRPLVESALRPGDYFLLTCGCGDPGCNGLFEPFEVRHDDGKITWHITDPEPERWFEFSPEQYRHAICDGLKSIITLSTDRWCNFGPFGMSRKDFVELLQVLEKPESSNQP